jgi:hypothetical protein
MDCPQGTLRLERGQLSKGAADWPELLENIEWSHVAASNAPNLIG